MSVARINIKNIDYFKYKKLVIDGNRDDYVSCSKEVKLLCDSVQTLKFRDEEFDDETDRTRFEDVCNYYRDILASKRIDPTDMRIKSGWWGDHKNSYSAGKLKPGVLKDVLVAKTIEWERRKEGTDEQINAIVDKIEGPGIYVFKHKEHQCFQSIGRADKVFPRVAERLRMAFEGQSTEPLSALLIMSNMSDWEFYFIPVGTKDNQRLLRILENDLILKHDCIWPHGLNFCLHIDSLLEVSEFRKSCLRHHWPPDGDSGDIEPELNIEKLRQQTHTMNMALMARNGDGDEGAGGGSNASSAASTPSTVKPRIPPTVILNSSSIREHSIQQLYDELDESASMISAQTYTMNTPGMSAGAGAEIVEDVTHTPTRNRSPVPSSKARPNSASSLRDPSGGTPRKTAQSRLAGQKPRPTTPKTRPKSDPKPDSKPDTKPSERSDSIESIDTKTVILSRSESSHSVNENDAPVASTAPASPARKAGAAAVRASRLQRPSSGTKTRPDTLKIAAANKPR